MWQVLLGGGIVLSGVLLAEWLTRQRDRSEKVRANTHELAFSVAIFIAYYSEQPESPVPDSDYAGPYWTLRQSVLRMLAELRYLPRWPMRNAQTIRDAAEEMLTLFTAVELRFHRGKRLSLEEQTAIHSKNDLHSLVFGLGVPPQDKLNWYIDNGFEELVEEMWKELEEENDSDPAE